MARRKLLFPIIPTALALALLPVAGSVSTAEASGSCSISDHNLGRCEGAPITVREDRTSPGTGGSDSSRGDSGNRHSNPAPPEKSERERVMEEACRVLPIDCDEETPSIAKGLWPDDDDSDDSTGPITVSDLASFSPESVHTSMEPDGWMIVGLPANFTVDASTNIDSGTLFDHDVDVRFTPRTYDWSWGDGSHTTTSTAGSTWNDLGVDDFSATDTSHTYTKKGTYTISVSVSYDVEMRAGDGPWFPVQGTLTASAENITAVAATADSVLVQEQCSKNPSGPGC